MRYILAHDVGTTGDKATLYDAEGQLIGSRLVPYGTVYPYATWAEQNPDDWWRAFCVATQGLLRDAHVSPADVACVVFSGQMMGMVAVDGQGRPRHNAIIWADQRSIAQTERVAGRIESRRVYEITGHRLSPSYSAGKILWLRDHQPEAYAETAVFLQAKDFLAARLTGALVTDPSDASSTNLYSLTGGDWSAELLDAFEIPREKLPAIRPSTSVIGETGATVAEETGLRAGTPVVIGGGDGSCAATGAGVIREGVAYNYIGSSSWIGVATPEPILDPDMRTFTWAHLLPGLFTPTGTMQAAGSSYQWARDELARDARRAADGLGLSPYEVMNLEVAQAPAGARGLLYLPYLLGERSPRWNPEARGAFVGLTIRHTHADMLRAVLEGVTYNLRVILEAFQRQGATISELRVIGGGARGAVWNGIMADVFGLPVARLTLLEEATSMGAAIAGGIGIGLWKDFSQVDAMVNVERITQPDAERHARYSTLYAAFNRTYDALDTAGIFHLLAPF